jgi:hypothetical protein
MFLADGQRFPHELLVTREGLLFAVVRADGSLGIKPALDGEHAQGIAPVSGGPWQVINGKFSSGHFENLLKLHLLPPYIGGVGCKSSTFLTLSHSLQSTCKFFLLLH